VTNLVTNAIESIGNNAGEIVVTVGVRTAAEMTHIKFHPQDWKPDDMPYACISVQDTGSGMDADTLEKVFDPFFSTHFTGRGLGLPVSLGIVKAHNGAIAVVSETGKGSQFTVYFPLSADTPQQFRIAGPAAPPTDITQRLILVVDDEPMVRKMVQTMLVHFGYEVISAADGYEAMKLFDENKDDIRCVLLDLTMPGMNGWETLAALRRIRPNVPVILASGYDEANVMGEDHTERPQVFLHKPYRMADLKATLSRACEDMVKTPQYITTENRET
jgi:CheY-like chemotaxis protein